MPDVPTRAERFSFGLWAVGWPARDPFGDATRPPLDPVVAVQRLLDLGAYGVTFHDDDLIPFGTDDPVRTRHVERFEGPRHFDYKPMRTEDVDGVWASAAANMRTYLLLRERAAAFRADPEVRAALEVSRVPELAVPTLADDESYVELLADPTAYEAFDPDAEAARGLAYAQLDQLAIEHALGAR